MTRLILAAFAATLLCAPAFAQDDAGFDPAAAFAAMDGAWEGVLAYPDSETGERVEMPLTLNVRAAPDGSFIVVESAFTDPGHTFYDASLIRWNEDSQAVDGASVGGGVSTFERKATSMAAVDGGWTLVATGEGYADGAPAEVRFTYGVQGDTFSLLTEVRPEGSTDDHTFRNELVVTRVSD